MTFDDIAKTLTALEKAISDRGGDSSAFAATAAFLRSSAKTRPADFFKSAKEAAKAGLRLPRATEVMASSSVEALDALTAVQKAAGAPQKTLKAIAELRAFFKSNATASLDALSEAVKQKRRAPAKAKAKPASKPAAKPAARSAAKATAKPAAKPTASKATATRRTASASASRAKATGAPRSAAKARAATKPAAKPAAKTPTKTAAKTAANTSSKTASKPVSRSRKTKPSS